MPKTIDAFALRDFDAERILQRPYFRKFGFEVDKTDEEVLQSMRGMNFDSFETTQQKLVTIEDFIFELNHYMVCIERHMERLKNYMRLLEYKITTDETIELKPLRIRHKKAQDIKDKHYEVIFCDIVKFIEKVFGVHEELEKKIKTHYRKVFATRLKQARKLTGLTQEVFAPKVGLTKNGYALYETARRDPSIPTLVRISKELRTSVDWLLGLKP